jgi:hypothetical protein
MAQYNVNHVCGHSQEHVLYGPHKERDRKLEWLKGQLCAECWKAEKAAKLLAEGQAAAQANADAGLPALTGSEKQIAWAEQIRKPVMAVAEEYASRPVTNPKLSEMARGELQDLAALIASELRGQTAAKWWIDNRDDLSSPHVFLRNQIESRISATCPTAHQECEAIRSARQAEADAKAAADKRAHEAELARQRAQAEQLAAERESAEHAADTFRVSSVECGGGEGAEIRITSRDGRTASGWILDGEWAICTVDGREINSSSRQAEGLAKGARKMWLAARGEVACG